MHKKASAVIIRKYESSDCKHLAELFYNTIHSINIRDYTKEQVNVWATGNINLEDWNNIFLSNFTVVAIKDHIIVGFGNIEKTGYLDKLFVHKDYQNQGIATAICNELESAFDVDTISTHASITAKPFFEKRGYSIIKKQEIERKGILLTNYIMEKQT